MTTWPRSLGRAALIFQLAIAGALANAQPQPATAVNQTNSGAQSPNVNAPNGQVWINYIDIKNLVGNFVDKGDKASQEIAAKLRAGDFEGAEQLIRKALAERQAKQAEFAFLHAAQGTVALSRRQPLRAERAFALATALAPSNCEYRGRWAQTLNFIGRLETLSEAAGPDSPEASECLRHASAIDKSRFLFAQTTLDALARQAPAAYDKLDQLEALFAGVLDSTGKVTWEAALLGCRMNSLTAELRRPKDTDRTERLRKLCQGLGSRAAASRDPLGRLVSGDEQENSDDRSAQIKGLRSQIAIVRTAPRIGELGLDREGKDVYLGRLVSELGFLILWSDSPDLAEVRQLYGEAFKLLEPRAAADNPDATIHLSQLIFRIAHFDEMHSSLALKIDLAHALGGLARRVAMRPYDPVPSVCHGLNRLDAVIRLRAKVVLPADAALVTKERDRCLSALEKSAPVFLEELRRDANLNDAYALRDQGLSAEALLLADKAVASGLAARGFPFYVEESYKLLEAVELRATLRFDLNQNPQALQDAELQLTIARQQKKSRSERTALQNVYAGRQRANPDDRMGIFKAGQEWMQTAHEGLTAEAKANANGTVGCSVMSDFMLAAQAGFGSAFAAARSQDVARAIGLVQAERKRAANCTGFLEAPGETRDINQFIRGRIAVAFFDIDFAAAVLAPPVEGHGSQFADDAMVREVARLEQLGLKLPVKDLPVSTQLFETWREIRQAPGADGGTTSKP